MNPSEPTTTGAPAGESPASVPQADSATGTPPVVETPTQPVAETPEQQLKKVQVELGNALTVLRALIYQSKRGKLVIHEFSLSRIKGNEVISVNTGRNGSINLMFAPVAVSGKGETSGQK